MGKLKLGTEPTAWENLGYIFRDPLYFIEGLLNVGEHKVIREQVAKMQLAEQLDPDIGRPGHAMSVREALENNGYDWETGKRETQDNLEPDVWHDLLEVAKARK